LCSASENPENLRRLVDNMWILVVPFIALCVFLCSFLNALAFNLMWLWFLVPLGLPVLTMWHSYGIVVMASIFQKIPKTEFTKPVVVILVGYVIKTFFMAS
jgi:hypothetical protein